MAALGVGRAQIATVTQQGQKLRQKCFRRTGGVSPGSRDLHRRTESRAGTHIAANVYLGRGYQLPEQKEGSRQSENGSAGV